MQKKNEGNHGWTQMDTDGKWIIGSDAELNRRDAMDAEKATAVFLSVYRVSAAFASVHLIAAPARCVHPWLKKSVIRRA